MWNTDFVIPGLLVLATLLVFYFIRPRLPNRLNKAFLVLIITDIATILLDYLASSADNNYAQLSVPLVSALNLLYFVAFIARNAAFYQMAVVLLKLNGAGISRRKAASFSVFAVCELIVLKQVLHSIHKCRYSSDH